VDLHCPRPASARWNLLALLVNVAQANKAVGRPATPVSSILTDYSIHFGYYQDKAHGKETVKRQTSLIYIYRSVGGKFRCMLALVSWPVIQALLL
jgi:hypothetical protein